jgi:hypothetical protein
MRELPTGTVTMLFSDIEGSTVLLSRLGARYGEALSAQRAVLRAAISDWCGHELGTEGDSFLRGVRVGRGRGGLLCCGAAHAGWVCVARRFRRPGPHGPAPATPWVGRDSDREQLRGPDMPAGVRLVTLTGPGGVGKTRLAIDAAASLDDTFRQGIYFSALATVRDADVMWKAIVGDLSVDGDEPAAVMEHLRHRQTLLVLGNLEQLHGSAEARRHGWPVPPRRSGR